MPYKTVTSKRPLDTTRRPPAPLRPTRLNLQLTSAGLLRERPDTQRLAAMSSSEAMEHMEPGVRAAQHARAGARGGRGGRVAWKR